MTETTIIAIATSISALSVSLPLVWKGLVKALHSEVVIRTQAVIRFRNGHPSMIEDTFENVVKALVKVGQEERRRCGANGYPWIRLSRHTPSRLMKKANLQRCDLVYLKSTNDKR